MIGNIKTQMQVELQCGCVIAATPQLRREVRAIATMGAVDNAVAAMLQDIRSQIAGHECVIEELPKATITGSRFGLYPAGSLVLEEGEQMCEGDMVFAVQADGSMGWQMLPHGSAWVGRAVGVGSAPSVAARPLQRVTRIARVSP